MDVVCSLLNMCEPFTMIRRDLYNKTYGDMLWHYELHCDVIAVIELAHNKSTNKHLSASMVVALFKDTHAYVECCDECRRDKYPLRQIYNLHPKAINHLRNSGNN